MRHATPHFQHVFAGDGYSSGYYSYMWSEVMDADAFAAFRETGDVFDPATARRLADCILSAGGSRERGRPLQSPSAAGCRASRPARAARASRGPPRQSAGDPLESRAAAALQTRVLVDDDVGVRHRGEQRAAHAGADRVGLRCSDWPPSSSRWTWMKTRLPGGAGPEVVEAEDARDGAATIALDLGDQRRVGARGPSARPRRRARSAARRARRTAQAASATTGSSQCDARAATRRPAPTIAPIAGSRSAT